MLPITVTLIVGGTEGIILGSVLMAVTCIIALYAIIRESARKSC